MTIHTVKKLAELKRLLILLFMFIFVGNLVLINTATALSPEQKRLYDLGVGYHDIETGDKCTFDKSLPNNADNNQVYIVGDSYSVGINDILTKDLRKANYEVIGRNLDNAGTITSNGGDGGTPAIDALDIDKDKFADAGSVVVLLGTNPGDYANDIPKFMDKLRANNNTAQVFWMTIGYTKVSDSNLDERNAVITKLSKEYDYKIVDWRSVQSKKPGLISGDRVHPTSPEGYQALSKLFVDAMGEYSENSRSSTSSSNKFMTTNKNQSNPKRVWTFLTSPDGAGLTALQAAAVMGNLERESGPEFNTKATNPSSGAYGIAQWLGTRKDELERFAAKHPGGISNLDIQLNYMKDEFLSDDFQFMFKLLKKQTDIIEATVIFHGTSGTTPPKFVVPELEGNRGFEASGDDLSDVREGRGGNAKKWYKKFKGSDPSGLAGAGSPSECLCKVHRKQSTTVYLDPGHSGKDVNGIDAATGIRDHDYPNVPEINDVWDVAQVTKKELEKKGYDVVLSKDTADEASNLRTKAAKAESSNADIAVSIHTDPGLPDTGWITIPKVGQYRTNNQGKDIEYTSDSSADLSSQYAEQFLTARKDKEGNDIIMKDINFDGRAGLAKGNIPLIMLFSKTPWIYLEKKAGEDGLTKKQKNDYVDSIVAGISQALPIQDTPDTAVEDCPDGSNGTGSASIIDKIVEYAWEDGRKVANAPKPAYKKDTDSAEKQERYVGQKYTDCGGFVTRVMQNTVDKNYGGGGYTLTQQQYVENKKEKYEALGPQNNTTKLQPGDIAIVNAGSGEGASGHTFFFTGKINNKWKGNGAQASLNTQVPRATDVYFADDRGQYKWYRYQ